jgi:acetylglutamate kinase
MSEPTQELKEKAATLAEALPYLRRYSGAVVVIKCGGAVLLDPAVQSSVLGDITLLRYAGMKPVLVHGGGPEISEMMRRLGKEPKIVEGLRVTDAETMDIVQMVLVGRINQQIVAAINQQGGRAVGLSGRDDMMLVAVKRTGPVDLGQVGEIEESRPQLLLTLLQEGYVPVVAPIASGLSGETFNLNADHAAGRLAGALKAAKLIILSDVPGVLRDRRDESSLISAMTAGEAQKALDTGAVEEGMRPKIEGCLSALRGGVERCHIIDGRIPHALLMEILTDVGIGTMITA